MPLFSPMQIVGFATWRLIYHLKMKNLLLYIISVPDGFKSPRRSKEFGRSKTMVDKHMMNGKPMMNGKANGHVPFMG